MRRKISILPLFILALVAGSCRDRTDRTEGSVLLSVSDFDGLPIRVSLANPSVQIETLTLRNTPKIASPTSALQDIELRSYEVTYTRLDRGTRLPPVLVEGLFGIVTVNGTSDFNNLPFMRPDQLNNVPLSDLRRFGADQETGSTVIPLKVTMRFFGRTLAGDDVVSEPASFNVDVVP
jgi:hypothetical protein